MQHFKADEIFEHMVELRRELHRYPELSYEEVETARRIMAQLDRIGLDYDYGGKGGGVVARLDGGGAGAPTVALRAEMDALPGKENTGLPFASQNPGRMHVCGHDVHMTMVLGAAELLAADPPEGNVVFVFQPGEERGGGSRRIIETGALDDIGAIFAGHVTREYPVGEIMIKDGAVTSQSDTFRVSVHGKGGHGARPHEGIDAVVIAASIINAVQTLVSRETNPVHPSVITIGRVESGSAANVIAERAYLEGSIRSTLPEVRDHLHRGLRRMAGALGELHGAKIELEIEEGYPPVINTEREVELARHVACEIVGRDRLRRAEHPSMGSEDFSFYLQNMPGAFVRFGARGEDEEFIPLHSPSFVVDEEVMRVGATFFDRLVRHALPVLATNKARLVSP